MTRVDGSRSRTAARPGSLVEQACRELKRRILDNELAPGHQALEQEVALALGMSRTPVREAFIRLENEGLVEVIPRHGMRVLPISADDMREIYDTLTGLEATAAELVARRGLDEAERAALERTVTDMEAALERDDRRAWAAADERFHQLLVDLSGNRRLASLVYTFWDQAHRARMATLELRPKPVGSTADHRAVVEAILRREPHAAREIHRLHRIRGGETLLDILGRHDLDAL
jgi:DNA-binding GntR family transcriptional regulator